MTIIIAVIGLAAMGILFLVGLGFVVLHYEKKLYEQTAELQKAASEYKTELDHYKKKFDDYCNTFARDYEAQRADAMKTQSSMIADELQLLREQNAEVEKIGQYFFSEYKTEIGLGYHAGRSLSSIVIGYLSKERAQKVHVR
jgi:uncharacterized membrane-anchored protein YhcB (DUF1043 family)